VAITAAIQVIDLLKVGLSPREHTIAVINQNHITQIDQCFGASIPQMV
jgi:hypothetical protein